jgi:hypothetical protein
MAASASSVHVALCHIAASGNLIRINPHDLRAVEITKRNAGRE